MKPINQRINPLLPDNRVFLDDRRALFDVHFGPPFLNRHEISILLERRDQRLMFVGHFLIQFRRAIAGRLGQEIPNRSGVLLLFPISCSFPSEDMRLACFKAREPPLTPLPGGSHYDRQASPLAGVPVAGESRAGYASSRNPATEINYFFASSMRTLN
jgi:hypothetical protein